MELINLTPHTITLVPSTGHPIVLPPSTEYPMVRVTQQPTETYNITNGPYLPSRITIPVKVLQRCEPATQEPLPPVVTDRLYIVSRLVADVYASIREDFVFPYDLTRTDTGGITGCCSLARFTQCR